MSGLAKLEARIEALHWAARFYHGQVDGANDLTTELHLLASVLEAARDLVRPDYAGEPEEPAETEVEEMNRAEVAGELPPIQEITGETKRLAQAALDDLERDDLNSVCDADGQPLDPAERWDAPTPAPAGVIRAWAQKQGITCPPVGLLGAALLNVINDRRRMLRLRPFVQSATAAGGEA
jgi:hypothetical protein